ncbi:hypothetical protein BOX15_Mlig005569g3, partial [Macrostomum lignano]
SLPYLYLVEFECDRRLSILTEDNVLKNARDVLVSPASDEHPIDVFYQDTTYRAFCRGISTERPQLVTIMKRLCMEKEANRIAHKNGSQVNRSSFGRISVPSHRFGTTSSDETADETDVHSAGSPFEAPVSRKSAPESRPMLPDPLLLLPNQQHSACLPPHVSCSSGPSDFQNIMHNGGVVPQTSNSGDSLLRELTGDLRVTPHSSVSSGNHPVRDHQGRFHLETQTIVSKWEKDFRSAGLDLYSNRGIVHLLAHVVRDIKMVSKNQSTTSSDAAESPSLVHIDDSLGDLPMKNVSEYQSFCRKLQESGFRNAIVTQTRVLFEATTPWWQHC